MNNSIISGYSRTLRTVQCTLVTPCICLLECKIHFQFNCITRSPQETFRQHIGLSFNFHNSVKYCYSDCLCSAHYSNFIFSTSQRLYIENMFAKFDASFQYPMIFTIIIIIRGRLFRSSDIIKNDIFCNKIMKN